MPRLSYAVLVLGISLAAPAGASGQAVTGGSPLNRAPNLHGCEIKPTMNDFSGNYSAAPSNTADCTWFSSGIFGTGGNSGAVTRDGRITNVTIRTNPADPPVVRFTVARLYADAASGSRQCCFLAAQTNPVQAAPGISSHAVNLPVERNTNTANNLVTQDYIGVSAVSGTGILPIFTNGRNNTLSDYTFGNNTAGFIYPRLGSQPGDGGGGRREEGIPGVEVLLRYTLCPSGQVCGNTTGGVPVLTDPGFGPRTFRVGPANTPIAARAKRGSTLSFRLSEAATVRIAIERPAKGRRSKGKCRKPSRRLRRAKRCTRWAKVRTLTRRNRPAGANRIKFTGRFRGKALKPGRYRASITATNAAKRKSKVRRASFRIVR